MGSKPLSPASGPGATPAQGDEGLWDAILGPEPLDTQATLLPRSPEMLHGLSYEGSGSVFSGLAGYPASGGRQVSSAGGILIDLTDNSSQGPGIARQRLFPPYPIATDITGIFNSILIIADDDVMVTFVPGWGKVNLDSCGMYELPVRGVQSMHVHGDRPFVFSAIFNAQNAPVRISAVTHHQERWGSQTITKTNAAGVADDYTYIDFASSDATTQMNPATYGLPVIHTGAIGQKDFIVTAASNNVDVVVECLIVEGKTYANSAATGSGTPLTAGDTLSIQLDNYCHLVRVGVRVQAAAAAAQSSAVTVQYRGFGAGF